MRTVPAAKPFHLSAQKLDPHAGGGGNERHGVPRADDLLGRFLRFDKIPGREFAQFSLGIKDCADGYAVRKSDDMGIGKGGRGRALGFGELRGGIERL